MIKIQSILLAATLCFAGSLQPVSAGSLVPDHYGDLYHEGQLRMTTDGRFYRSHEEDERDARRDAFDQAYIDNQRAIQHQIDVNSQIAINREQREQQAAAQQYAEKQAEAQAIAEAQQNAALVARQISIEGDQVPLSKQYDDEATIRMYLHNSGYTDLNAAQIIKVRMYMIANGIHHVSELDPTQVINN